MKKKRERESERDRKNREREEEMGAVSDRGTIIVIENL